MRIGLRKGVKPIKCKIKKASRNQTIRSVRRMGVSMGILPVITGESAKKILSTKPTITKEFIDKCRKEIEGKIVRED